ncbi:hypothetical protein KP79_PYT16368 [Mizuhopecten yessoensis]|uniref:Uncharacterized protein n=1 Tax=Mizuhopecten yessoensis TaxID=6573 RepID=A0A210PYM4_MIZYE|nr:hypothetical protein KP79_PYT16368 [Mizuhopecten yessoensis]
MNFPRFSSMEKSLKEIKKSTGQRLDKLGNKVNKVEKEIPTRVSEAVQGMKGDIIDSIKKDMDEVIGNRMRKMDDHRRREMNPMAFNLPESDKETSADRKREDIGNLIHLFQLIGIENALVKDAIRLGKTPTDKTRPAKITLENRSERKKIWITANKSRISRKRSLKKSY